VTGVLAPTEEPTHLDRDIFLAYATVADEPTVASWADIWNSHWTYVRLREGQSAADLTEGATSLFQRNVPRDRREGVGLVSQSLNDLRFGGTMLNPLSIRTQIPTYFYGFGLGLAVAVLLAAGFNYVNLTTAHSLQRAKEIGVRKAVGANRGQLAMQFLGESLVTCLLGSLGAFLLLTFLLPAFNNLYLWNLLELPALSGDVWAEPVLLALLFGITLLFGLAAGAYPALVLSRSKPKEVMGFSPSVSSPFGSLSLRKVLIGAQFAFALVLLVTATTLYRQSAKMTSAAFDLKTDRMVAVDLQDVDLERFRRAAERDPDVAAIAGLDLLPLSVDWDTDPVRIDPDDVPIQIYRYDADTSFVQDMGLSLEAARPDWRVIYSSGDGVLINETAAHGFGFETATNAVGTTMYRGDSDDGDDVIPYTVVGVVDNFAATGAGQIYTGRSRQVSPPLFFRADTVGYSRAVVRARTADLAALRDRLEAMWTQDLQTDYPFTSRFYSELTQERNGPMQDLSSIAGFTTFLAILITLLGLLSLAAHTVQTRTKEIGIRKALGATLSGLVVLLSRDFVVLLSRDFVRLVGAAVVAALPVAWWPNAQWLRFVPDPVAIGLSPVALAVVVLLTLAVLTVASQTFRAARLNPATTLRDE